MNDFLRPDLLPAEISTWTIWLLGLTLGLTACTATCLPFMGTWLLGRNNSNAKAGIDTALFVAGRLMAYTLLGSIAGGAGRALARVLHAGYGSIAIGTISIAAGLWLLTSRTSLCKKLGAVGNAPPLLIGFSLSLTPCAPLASLLAVCAATNSAGTGFVDGLVFGLGAALSPLLVLLPLINVLGTKMRENRNWINRWMRMGSAGVLILLGLVRLQLAL